MAQKKFKLGQERGYIGDSDSKPKPPREIDNSWIYEHWYKRDIVVLNDIFVCEETKQLIRERINNNFYGETQR